MAEPTGSIIRMPKVINSMGMSTIAAPSQQAVTTAIDGAMKTVDAAFQPKGDYATNTALNNKLDKSAVVQSTGSSTTSVMSQEAVTDALTASMTYPVGAPIPWSQSTPPSGYLVCNGQSFNKTTYPLLALAYPSGILPDLRGEFIRGLDAGRGVDNGRVALSGQGDAIRNITGGFLMTVGFSDKIFPSGAFAAESGYKGAAGEDWNGSLVTFDPSRVVPVANENRPRNIAFLYIVRAA